MTLTEEELNKRLNSPDNLANRFGVKEIVLKRPGRKIGVPNFSPEEKQEVAERALLGERQNKLAAEFNMTQARVSQLENGEAKSLDQDALSSISQLAREKAVERLLESLHLLTPEKIKKESAYRVSCIAGNLSKVAYNLSDDKKSDANIQVIVYTPELRKESSFKVIDV